MAAVPCLPVCNIPSSCILKAAELSTPRTFGFNNKSPIVRKFSNVSFKSCRCSTVSSSITEFDLYDLLGVDSSSDQSQIKLAYRSLQKRCHPDIAGQAGHDMAIILNEAYSILSDPNSRSAYDKEQAKVTELKGFTGRPIYSVWFGSESEQRAVFVDEVKCVGCLKCALLAEKTFAIESVYGRARVVAQWAEHEHRIQAAIDACPVNCISMVERSDLAALEFLMSKQPRGPVRIGGGNTAGARVSNIFVEVQKFQTRFQEAKEKNSKQTSRETDLQREARMSAIQAIRSISSWMYWQTPKRSGTMAEVPQNLTFTADNSPQPNIDRIRNAAARRQLKESSSRTDKDIPLNFKHPEQYWVPSTHALPSLSSHRSNQLSAAAATKKSPTKRWTDTKGTNRKVRNNEDNPIRWSFPMVTATIGVAIVRLQGIGAVHGVRDHMGGSIALDIVNSSWLQVMLAAATWYIIGVAVLEFIAAIGSKENEEN